MDNSVSSTISYRLDAGKPIEAEIWNKQDDLRRIEFEKFLRWFVGAGADVEGITWVYNDNKVTFSKNGEFKPQFFRLFINGAYLVLETQKAYGKDSGNPILGDKQGDSKKLYIFAYEYQRPVIEPWNDRVENQSQWIGSIYAEDYRKWLCVPDNFTAGWERLPQILYADRLVRDFAFAWIQKDKQIEEQFKQSLQDEVKTNLVKAIKKSLAIIPDNCSIKSQLNKRLADLEKNFTISIFGCRAYLKENQTIDTVRFCPRTAPKAAIIYPQEIAVRMTPNLLLNPIDWNLSDKFRRMEQERFLYWLVDGKEGKFLCKDQSDKCLYATKYESENKKIDDESMILISVPASLKPSKEPIIQREKWSKEEGIDTSERITVEERIKTDEEVKITVKPPQLGNKCYEDWMNPLPLSKNDQFFQFRFLKLKLSEETTDKKEISAILNMAEQYYIPGEDKAYTDLIVSSIANEVLSGVPVTAEDWNAMDDIRRFHFQRLVRCLATDGIMKNEVTFNQKEQNITLPQNFDMMVEGQIVSVQQQKEELKLRPNNLLKKIESETWFALFLQIASEKKESVIQNKISWLPIGPLTEDKYKNFTKGKYRRFTEEQIRENSEGVILRVGGVQTQWDSEAQFWNPLHVMDEKGINIQNKIIENNYLNPITDNKVISINKDLLNLILAPEHQKSLKNLLSLRPNDLGKVPPSSSNSNANFYFILSLIIKYQNEILVIKWDHFIPMTLEDYQKESIKPPTVSPACILLWITGINTEWNNEELEWKILKKTDDPLLFKSLFE